MSEETVFFSTHLQLKQPAAKWALIGAVVGALSMAVSFGGIGLIASSRANTNLTVASDDATGCEYMITRQGNLTPRLDRQGFPMCGGAGHE